MFGGQERHDFIDSDLIDLKLCVIPGQFSLEEWSYEGSFFWTGYLND
jgi:hypothetical protein